VLIKVQFVGDSFVAEDAAGKPVTDPAVMEYISFSQFDGNGSTFYVNVPAAVTQDISAKQKIKININTQTT
jgi:hypothetical protein